MINDIVPYLGFDGNCEAAFSFYEKAMGGEIIALIRYKDMPPEYQMGPEASERIMHINLKVGNAYLMGGDAPPGRAGKHDGYSISLQLGDSLETETVFTAMAEGGQITMPIGESAWAYRFGMLTDKFGIPWMVNYQKPISLAPTK